jgi:hypothetical protein
LGALPMACPVRSAGLLLCFKRKREISQEEKLKMKNEILFQF